MHTDIQEQEQAYRHTGIHARRHTGKQVQANKHTGIQACEIALVGLVAAHNASPSTLTSYMATATHDSRVCFLGSSKQLCVRILLSSGPSSERSRQAIEVGPAMPRQAGVGRCR